MPMKLLLTFNIAMLLVVSACGGGTTTSTNSPLPTGCKAASDDYSKTVLADSPVAYYRLDEATGSVLCDASPHHNDGKYAATGVTQGQPGALHRSKDTAIVADGTAQVAMSNAATGIAGSTDFTIEGWFKTSTRQDQMVVDIGQGGAQNMAGVGPWFNHLSPTYVLTPGTGDYVTFDTFDGTIEFDAAAVGIDLFDGRWHYVAVTYTAGSGMAAGYLDNHALGTASVQEKLLASTVRIGYWVDTAYNKPFNGSLDEIAVYSSALSASRIARHFAAA